MNAWLRILRIVRVIVENVLVCESHALISIERKLKEGGSVIKEMRWLYHPKEEHLQSTKSYTALYSQILSTILFNLQLSLIYFHIYILPSFNLCFLLCIFSSFLLSYLTYTFSTVFTYTLSPTFSYILLPIDFLLYHFIYTFYPVLTYAFAYILCTAISYILLHL